MAISDALQVQNYAYKTLKNYKQALVFLLRYAAPKPVEELTKPQYQKYLLYLIEKKGLSRSTLNVHINAYKFYQEKVLQREKEYYEIAYPRQATKLPTVCSASEVKEIFNATTSFKYRALFTLIYATGLRLSKVAYLRLTDLDRIRRLIHIRRGKGKKDRVVMLTDKLEMILDTYMARYRPKTYLFEVVVSDESLQNCSIQQVYSDTVRLAGALNEGEFIPCLIHLLRTY